MSKQIEKQGMNVHLFYPMFLNKDRVGKTISNQIIMFRFFHIPERPGYVTSFMSNHGQPTWTVDLPRNLPELAPPGLRQEANEEHGHYKQK